MRIDNLAIPTSHPVPSRADHAVADRPLRRDDAIESNAGARPRRSAPELSRLLESRHDDLESVPPRFRTAVSAYIANQPSAIERLGVELAGIDEYV